jgi:hypothetical protein
LRRLPPLVANLALALASASVALLAWVAVEAVLRLSNPRYLERFSLDDMSYLHTYSETYGWVPRAGFRLRLSGLPETSINRLGYRGREYSTVRTPGHPRVLMLGDSLAFGYGVADDETSSRQLELGFPGLEVVNLAVQGYGTDQALLRFEREGLAYAPDAAILNFCTANDFRDNGARRAIYDGAYPKPYFTLDDGRLTLHDDQLALSPFARLALFLHQRSILFNALRSLVAPKPAASRDDLPPPEHAPDRELTVALLRRFGDVARAHRVRLIVAIYPTLRDFIKPSRRAQLIVEAPGMDDVRRVDLRPLLEAHGVTRETFDQYSLDGSFHANARGQRLVAEILAGLLGDDGILGPPPTAP